MVYCQLYIRRRVLGESSSPLTDEVGSAVAIIDLIEVGHAVPVRTVKPFHSLTAAEKSRSQAKISLLQTGVHVCKFHLREKNI